MDERKIDDEVSVRVPGAAAGVGMAASVEPGPAAAGPARVPAGVDHGGVVQQSAPGLLAPPRPGTVRERAFVPKDLAVKAIETATGDMRALKARALGAVERMSAEYQAASERQHAWYEDVVRSMRERGAEHVSGLRDKLLDARRKLITAERRAERLREQAAAAERREKDAVEAARREAEETRARHAAEGEAASRQAAEALERRAQEAAEQSAEAAARHKAEVESREAAAQAKLASAVAAAEAHEAALTKAEARAAAAESDVAKTQAELAAATAAAAGGSEELMAQLRAAQEQVRAAEAEAEKAEAARAQAEAKAEAAQAAVGQPLRATEEERVAGSAPPAEAGGASADSSGAAAAAAASAAAAAESDKEVIQLREELAEARRQLGRAEAAAAAAAAAATGAAATTKSRARADLEAEVVAAEAAMKRAEAYAAEAKAEAATETAEHKAAKAEVKRWLEEYKAEHDDGAEEGAAGLARAAAAAAEEAKNEAEAELASTRRRLREAEDEAADARRAEADARADAELARAELEAALGAAAAGHADGDGDGDGAGGAAAASAAGAGAEWDGECGADLVVLRRETSGTVESAKGLWREKKKRECLDTLVRQSQTLSKELALGEAGAGAEGAAIRARLGSGVERAQTDAESSSSDAERAKVLRVGLDRFLKEAAEAEAAMDAARAAERKREEERAAGGVGRGAGAGTAGQGASGAVVALLKQQLARALRERDDVVEAAGSAREESARLASELEEAKAELEAAQAAAAAAAAAQEEEEADGDGDGAGDGDGGDTPTTAGAPGSRAAGAGAAAGAAAGGAGSKALKKRAEAAEAEAAKLRKAAVAAKRELKEAREAQAKAESEAKRAAARASAAVPSKADAKREAEKAKREKKAIEDLKARARQAEAERDAAAKAQTEAERALAAAQRRAEADAGKQTAELEAAAAAAKRDTDRLERDLTEARKQLAAAEAERDSLKAERTTLKARVAELGSLDAEVEGLRAEAKRAKEMEKAMAAAAASEADMAAKYKKEVVLRKQYWNMMEDMKGKIRVICRTRPMSRSEEERGCASIVEFPDTFTIDVTTSKGVKSFVFDQCFGPASAQEEVFEDTERLVQSAFDGFNVCIFAYGQTGSGKTFTMSGSPDMPGITPRAIAKLFGLIESHKADMDVTVTASMVEIYNEQLRDLLYRAANVRNKKALADPPKLQIKVDAKGWVNVKNSHIEVVTSVDELLGVFDSGNSARAVGSTKMNSESSRSHSVFSIMLEAYNRITKKTTRGKLSLVDLAGSERAGKTGATADRLKEAQAINKSLSALGNVISALSSGEKHIPYRDNLLTRLMQDSLGGTAKTLMFCCCSPADYNDEETLSTLVYAARVKLITNEAKKEEDSAEVTRLKRIIKKLKAGEAVDEDEDAGGGAGAAAAASAADD
ncbi:hypothetical protein FNF31_06655 [Cafeteria roenbergensis]|uniref:Kinesin motor domain-containing protein n=1 Tax=Cafeteria roenbergensis TaxID=33653 RepID=A0A5A8CJI1_CAFRO|nr:hypothetical protein FNF31_06655 [Cafeteria roenbergensis]